MDNQEDKDAIKAGMAALEVLKMQMKLFDIFGIDDPEVTGDHELMEFRADCQIVVEALDRIVKFAKKRWVDKVQ